VTRLLRVIASRSRSKNGVTSLAYDEAIQRAPAGALRKAISAIASREVFFGALRA
jgi:hypothetical protein